MVAFAPSFWFIALGAERFERLRADARADAFLAGAGPAAIGAILGSSISGLLSTLLGAAIAGGALALAGAPLPS